MTISSPQKYGNPLPGTAKYWQKHPTAIVKANKIHYRNYQKAYAASPPITAIALSTPTVVGTSPVGTNIGNLSVTGGTAPYTYTLTNNDGGNFSLSGGLVKTAKTPITAGAHSVTVYAVGASGQSLSQTLTITVT
jgi:hypothetical protein